MTGGPTRSSTIDGRWWRLDDGGVIEDEAPGGTVGCDVCGIDLAEDKVEVHRAWHHHREERLDHLIRAVEELLVELRRPQAQ